MMRTMTSELILVRHGRVDPAWHGRIYGCLDVPLSDDGRAEAHRAAAYLARERLDAVVHSGLSRTRFGAACIAAGRPLEPRGEADLREIDRGAWARRTFEQLEADEPGAFAAWRAEPWTRRPPGGESMGDLSDRVLPVLDDLAREHGGGVVAVVAHSHVLRCALARALGRDDAMEQHVPTGPVLRFTWKPRGIADLREQQTFGSTDPA